MSTEGPDTWLEINQRHLLAALGHVRRTLQDRVPGSDGLSQDADDVEPVAAGDRDFALETLCARFGLTAFERALLLICAGCELDGSFAHLCAAVQGGPQKPYPTFGLALAALPGAHWSALSPRRPLRHARLIEVDPGNGLTQAPLRIDERVLHYLTGVQYLDPRLGARRVPPAEVVDSHRTLAERVVATWAQAADTGAVETPVIQLSGPDAGSKQAIAASACAQIGLNLAVIRAEALPTSASDLEATVCLWGREAILSRSALLLNCESVESADAARWYAVRAFIERLNGLVLVAVRDRQPPGQRTLVTFDVGRPTMAEQRALWGAALTATPETLNGEIDNLVTQFDVGSQTIRAAAAETLAHFHPSSDRTPDCLNALLWDACRAQARPKLDDLAQRIEPTATWDELILPEAHRALIRGIAVQVRQRATVYDRWGFRKKGTRGLGVSALFAGASGTGKTMAAEVLAGELRLDLYRIDLSSVVSKYIGETEKNLRRIFDAAEEGGAILLFDEADALFGKRSEVKDSHDRYANIEVSYLLQRMECYRGLAILTTNMRSALDTAFLRRIRFIVEFPFPSPDQRAEIWRRVFPAETPREGLDEHKLAQLDVTGGHIRNIALGAAFLAADAGEPVRMTHLMRAAQQEYAKLERTLTESETRKWEQ